MAISCPANSRVVLVEFAFNSPNVEVISARHANPVSLVRSDKVLLTRAAMAKLEELLK